MTKKTWLAAFAVLWVLDILTTAAFVTRDGLDMEANPLMHWVIASTGLWGFAFVKLALLAAIAYATPYMKRPWPLQGLTAVMTPVIALNLLVVFG